MSGSNDARVFEAGPPIPPAATGSSVLCVSGGGSRALSGALGQFSGLASLADPDDPTKSLLDRFDYLSSVSGGTWASVIFTYAPDAIADQLLIEPAGPAELVKAGSDDNRAGNVEYLDEHSIGVVPQAFGLTGIAKALWQMHKWGLFSDDEKRPWFWIVAIGEIVLKPFGLYDASYHKRKDFPEPKKFFASSAADVTNDVLPHNPKLGLDDFYLRRADRQPLYVNFNIIEDDLKAKATQIPVQVSGTEAGALGQSGDGSLVGGGSVQPFAFTSRLIGPGPDAGLVEVELARRYSLCDIAGCSSAFFAAFLLKYLNEAIDDVRDEVKRLLDHGILDKLINMGVDHAFKDIERFLDRDAAELIPTYDYWTIGEVGETSPTTTPRGFSDGGDFDNTGILGAVARSDVNRILSLVNSSSPISKHKTTHEILVSGQLAALFGYKGQPADGRWESYGGMSPAEPLSYVQVFDDANGEFKALREGLYAASSGGGELGSQTAAFRQTLHTVDNPVAHIAGGRKVDVVWLYNNRVNAWQDSLVDEDLTADLAKGQAGQDRDGTPSGKKGEGELADFPWYSTGQIDLSPVGVNMLAQLSAWNIAQIEPVLLDLLKSDK